MICFLASVVLLLTYLTSLRYNQQIYYLKAVVVLRFVVKKSKSMMNIMNEKATLFFVVGVCHQAQTIVQLL